MPIPEKIRITQLDIEINGGCNFKCQMCPQAGGRETEFLKKLPTKVMEKILDDAMQYGLQSVSLHGSGEPTLNYDMPDVVQAIKSRGLKCVSFTNAYRLDEAMSRRLIEARIDLLRVSAVGFDNESYNRWMSLDAFDVVRENVKRERKMHSRVSGVFLMDLF